MVSKFFISAMSLFIPLFIYWLGVGYYYYKRDTISRLELIVQEAKTQSLKKQVHSTSIGRAKVYIERTKVFNKFIQMLGLIFLDSVPWPTVWMSKGGSLVTLNFSFIGGDVVSFTFYVTCAVYVAHFGYMSWRWLRAYRKGLAKVRFGERFYFVNRILSETLYIPVLRIFFFMLNCNTSTVSNELVVTEARQTSFQDSGAEIMCWEGWHLYVITPLTLVCAMTLYPVAIWTLMDTSHETYTYVAKYNVIWGMGQTAMIAASVFLATEPYLALLMTTGTAVGLFVYDFRLAPVLGDGRYLNYWSAASFASVSWAGCCSFLALLWDDTTLYKHWPLMVMIVGMPLIGWLAYTKAYEHEEIRDRNKILKLKAAVQSKDLQFKLEAAENMAILTLSDDRRELVAHEVLEPMVDMFCNPNTDDKLRNHVAKALANLAANDNVRAKVFQPKLVKPLISMINNRRKMAIDNRRTAMMALCNMTFDPDLCPMLVDRTIDPKGLEYSIEQCQSHDDSVRKSAAQAVVNCAYSKREEIESILLTNRMLQSFIRLMGSKNLDMAILAVEILTPLVNPRTVNAMMDAGLLEDKFLPSMVRSEWADVRYYGERLQNLVKKNAKGLQGVNVKGKMFHHQSVADVEARPELRRLDTMQQGPICGGYCCSCFERMYEEIVAYKQADTSAKSGGGADSVGLLGRSLNIAAEDWDIIDKARQDRQRLYAEEQEAAAAAKRARRKTHRRHSTAGGEMSTMASQSKADIKPLADGEEQFNSEQSPIAATSGPESARSMSTASSSRADLRKKSRAGASAAAAADAVDEGDEKGEEKDDADLPNETKEEKKARKKAEKEAKKQAKKEEEERKKQAKKDEEERKKAEKEAKKQAKAAEKAAKKAEKEAKKAAKNGVTLGAGGGGDDDDDDDDDEAGGGGGGGDKQPLVGAAGAGGGELTQPTLSVSNTSGVAAPKSVGRRRSKSGGKGHKRSKSSAGNRSKDTFDAATFAANAESKDDSAVNTGATPKRRNSTGKKLAATGPIPKLALPAQSARRASGTGNTPRKNSARKAGSARRVSKKKKSVSKDVDGAAAANDDDDDDNNDDAAEDED